MTPEDLIDLFYKDPPQHRPHGTQAEHKCEFRRGPANADSASGGGDRANLSGPVLPFGFGECQGLRRRLEGDEDLWIRMREWLMGGLEDVMLSIRNTPAMKAPANGAGEDQC